jgi:beta-lactamase class A
MSLFKRNKDEEEDDEEYEERELSRKKIKDLKPENKKKRKEIAKPWGKKERYLVLWTAVGTVAISIILFASARSWKLPGMPKITLPSFNQDSIVITADKKQLDSAKAVSSLFRQKTDKLSGIYALYVVRLGDGFAYGVSEGSRMQAASLIKLPIMSLVYKKSDAGELNLDEKPTGSRLSYKELVEAMGQRSDNSAQITLVKHFGADDVQNYIDQIGMDKTSLAENETTPSDIGLFFQKLYGGQLVSEESRNQILNFLTDTIYEDWLVKGIPEVRVAHKYGREVHVVNDAGIVFAPKPFVLVLMTDGVVEKEADLIFPELARDVFSAETR